MALYAVENDDLIYASCAEPQKVYWCLDCFGPVKRRRGKRHFYHFYHIQSAPNCRLYSKTEDHLLAQLQLQKLFPTGILQIERPFIQIHRIADVLWEKEKIVFEIQCSSISLVEAEMRIRDYRSIGLDIIWLLDDKRYNKRIARPTEEYLRQNSAYYMSIKQGLYSKYYDQFEVFSSGQRVKRGQRLHIDLQKLRQRPKIQFNENCFPQQIAKLHCTKYFLGDRLHRALYYPLTMQYWRTLEMQLMVKKSKTNRFKHWLFCTIGRPYLLFLERLIKKMH